MTRENLKKIIEGITDEQINAVLDINTTDIGKAKKDYDDLTKRVDTLEGEKKDLEGTITDLKYNAKDGEDYKKLYENLKGDIEKKEKEEKEAKEKAERDANILNRYNAVAVDKNGKPLEWTHEAIKTDYLHKFAKALEDSANAGKSDADIFKTLTQDDGTAFKVPAAQMVYGGAGKAGENGTITKEVFAKMGYKDRVKLYSENKQLYEDLNGGNE